MKSDQDDVAPLVRDGAEAGTTELRRRERAWLRSRTATSLWPGLDLATIQEAADRLGGVVAAVLREAPAPHLDAKTAEARALGVAALLAGVGPLVGYWIETGRLRAGVDVESVFARHLAHGRARAERARHKAVKVCRELIRADAEPAAIKGFYTAHRYFPDPGTRPFGDIDLVVAPDRIAAAESTLRAAGFRPGGGTVSPYKRDWLADDDLVAVRSFEFWHAESRCKIELHDGLNFDRLLEHGIRLDGTERFADRWIVDGAELLAPDPRQLVAMLATHASCELHSMRLLRTVELALVIRHHESAGDLHWPALAAALDDAGALRFAAPAFELVEQLVPGTVDARLMALTTAASTSSARSVMRSITTTSPILDDRVSFAERIMFDRTAGGMFRRLWSMVRPPPNQTWQEALTVYCSRVLRLLTGRFRWAPPTHTPTRPPDLESDQEPRPTSR